MRAQPLARWIAVLLVAQAACTRVQPVPAPVSFITVTEPQKIWITRTDQSVVEIGAPRVVGDTLFGFRGTSFEEIPLHTISEVRARQSAPARTVSLALAFGAVAGVAYWKMNAQSSSTQSSCMGGEEDIC